MTASIDAAPNPAAATQPPADGGVACPRCGAAVAATQDWCLACGAGARTVMVRPPNWRLPATVVMTLAALAVIAAIAAFVVATNDDKPLVRTAPTAPVVPPTP